MTRLVQAFHIMMVVLGIASCASYGTIEEARTRTGPSCCTNIRDLPYQDLATNQRRQFDLDLAAPSFEFMEGLSRFAALRLPANVGPLDLFLKTFWIGNSGPQSFVFRPTLTFLDGDRAVIETLTPRVVWAGSFMAAQENLGWEGRIPVPTTARYLVVHTTRRQLGSALYIKEGVTKPGLQVIPMPTAPVVLQAGWWDVFLPTAESGRIAVELVPRR